MNREKIISSSTTGFGIKKNNPLYQSSANSRKIDKVDPIPSDMFSNTDSKMMKIKKKKVEGPISYNVKIVLHGNKGHPSMVGLTSIEFFDSKKNLIPVGKQNIVSPPPNQKIMNLFNG